MPSKPTRHAPGRVVVPAGFTAARIPRPLSEVEGGAEILAAHAAALPGLLDGLAQRFARPERVRTTPAPRPPTSGWQA